MTVKKNTCLLAALFSVSLPTLGAAADTQLPLSCAACGDNAAVSSLLLAAGMYGGLDSTASKQGLNVSLSESAKMFQGVISDQSQYDGQDITLSYTGSEGRLGFSAGYLYTAPENTGSSGTVLLDLNTANTSRNVLHEEADKPWYVTLNFAKDFQLNDSFSLGIDSRTMLLSPLLSDETDDTRAVCMSFNLPMSYGGLFTVTPELQWSRSLETGGQADMAAAAVEKNPNTFYGGMSISFSY